MAKSVSTRSTAISEKIPIASWPLLADTTRYPFVDSMNFKTESSCSLSSTQRMTFFGRMTSAYSFTLKSCVQRQHDSLPAPRQVFLRFVFLLLLGHRRRCFRDPDR